MQRETLPGLPSIQQTRHGPNLTDCQFWLGLFTLMPRWFSNSPVVKEFGHRCLLNLPRSQGRTEYLPPPPMHPIDAASSCTGASKKDVRLPLKLLESNHVMNMMCTFRPDIRASPNHAWLSTRTWASGCPRQFNIGPAVFFCYWALLRNFERGIQMQTNFFSHVIDMFTFGNSLSTVAKDALSASTQPVNTGFGLQEISRFSVGSQWPTRALHIIFLAPWNECISF